VISKLLVDIILLFRFFQSPFIHGQLVGWKLVGFYFISIFFCSITTYLIIHETFHDDKRRAQHKARQLDSELVKKSSVADDYRRLQINLDAAYDGKQSCVITLGKILKGKKYSLAPQIQKDIYDQQWHDCVDKKAVLQRVTKYYSENESVFVVFENPSNVLAAVAHTTRELNVSKTSYRLGVVNTEDFYIVIPLILEAKMPYEILAKYIEELDNSCANCLIKLNGLLYDTSRKSYSTTIKLILYLDPNDPKGEPKIWAKEIKEGKYSGQDLASYK